MFFKIKQFVRQKIKNIVVSALNEVIQESLEGYLKAILGNTSVVTKYISCESAKQRKVVTIGFLVHNIEAWSGLEPVYKAALKDTRFFPVVFSTNRKYAGNIYKDEELIDKVLNEKGIPHLRLYDEDSFKDLERIKSTGVQALFRQSQWQPDLKSAFRSEFLNFCRLYYLPYEIAPMTVHGMRLRPSFHEELCSAVFCVNSAVKSEFDRYNRGHRFPLVVSGHPKVDSILQAKANWPINTGNKKRVIWSAHHSVGVGWNDFGVFDKIYKKMLVLAQQRQDIDFLFSPHPALLHRISVLNTGTKTEIENFFNEWEKLPNTGIITAGQYLGPMKAADLLIIDGLSLLCEFQLNRKPVIQIVRPDSSAYSNFGKRVIDGAFRLKVEEMYKLSRLIDDCLNSNELTSLTKQSQERLYTELTEVKQPELKILDYVYKDIVD